MHLWRTLASLSRRRRLEAEMHEELQAHLELQIERNLAAGMPPGEAARAAQRQFGGRSQIEERCRDERAGRWLHDAVQDLRFSLRLIRRQPGFSAVVVAIFALAVGATAAMSSILEGVMLRPLAVVRPEGLVTVWETNPVRQVNQFSVSYPNYRDWRERSRAFSDLAAFDQRAVSFLGEREPERIVAEFQTANLLPLLGLEVALGRRFREGEDAPGSDPVVILSDRWWRRTFDADPAVLGRAVTIDGRLHTIIGVLPPDVGLFPEVDAVLPLGPIVQLDRTDHALIGIGRIATGVTPAAAEAELKAIAAQLETEYPDQNQGWSVRLEPLFDLVVSAPVRRVLQVLAAAVVLVLAVAAANVAGLLLVRAAARTREFAVRAALGGARGRLLRQLITECLLLATLGGAFGTLLAVWLVDAFRAAEGFNLPRAADVAVSGRVLLVAWLVAWGAGVLAAIFPALTMAHVKLLHGLKQGLNPVLSQQRARRALVVGQLALAVLLLATAGLAGSVLHQLRRVELGFHPGSTLTLRMAPTGDAKQFWQQLVARVEQLPGVEAVAVTNSPPMSELNTSLNVFPVGAARIPPHESIQAEWRVVSPGYFAALDIPVRAGETFSALGSGQPARAVVVNESFARALWGEVDAVGRQINPGGGDDYSTVIGVVGDVRTRDPGVAPAPGYYLSAQRFVWGHMTLVVRATKADALQLLPAIRAEVRALDPTVPLFDVRTLEGLIERRLATKRIATLLLGAFAGTAVALALTGLYGVMAFTTAQRTRESGIRLALGASGPQVVGPLLREGMLLAGAGVLVGGALAALLLPLVAKLIGSAGWEGAWVPVVACGGTLLFALLACLVPARHATRVDPTVALRTE